MATDPVERTRIEQRETPFTVNLRPRVDELCRMAPALEHGYISAYLDWRPEGENPGVRPGKTVLEQEVAAVRRKLKDSGADVRSFEADVERIMNFIDDGIDPAVHGIFVVANDASDVFEVIQLAMPFKTHVSVSPTPNLRSLVALVEDYPRFAVLHADQHDASLFIINRASPQSEVSLESNEYPRKQRQGGWSHRRFQARQDERIQHFARAVAEEVRRVMDEQKITMLVMSVGEVFASAINDEFHQTVKESIVGSIHLPATATESEIVEAAQKVAEQAERNQEAEDIQKLEDAIGSGNNGASGADDVVRALGNGQVMTLLMADDFEQSGWADYAMEVYGVGDVPASHPAGGDDDAMLEVDLAEEIVRLALATGARVEIVPGANAARLKRHGGVAALLRF